MAKLIELRRHTDNEADALSGDGVEVAIRLGQQLAGDYQLGVSTGAQRATQGKGEGVVVIADGGGFRVAPPP